MKFSPWISGVAATITLLPGLASGQLLGIHGSGTTNPSKCFWRVMDTMQSRAKLALHSTYRGIGSSSGQAEFSNDQKITHFGSGDIPLTSELYQQLSATETVYHLPVFVGAVSFYHNVPNTPTLNMTACTLAKIMKREITAWDHEEIKKVNPALKVSAGFPIRVARRVDGSSSTFGITNYFAAACPDVWGTENKGSTVEWPADTLECQGSGGVVDCISEEPGTIGYLDSSHGHGAGFEEVSLENRHGTKLTTVQSMANGGVLAAAAVEGMWPATPSADFSNVSLFWQPGEFTWPIAAMTYIYARQNLTFIPSPQEQALFKAFLQTLYDDSFVQLCVDAYEFAKVDGQALELATAAIDGLILNPSAVPFVFEESTIVQEGQGDYVISAKRSSSADVEFEALHTANEKMQAQIEELTAMLTELKQSMAQMKDEAEHHDHAGTTGGSKSKSALLPYQSLWWAASFVASLYFLSSHVLLA